MITSFKTVLQYKNIKIIFAIKKVEEGVGSFCQRSWLSDTSSVAKNINMQIN